MPNRIRADPTAQEDRIVGMDGLNTDQLMALVDRVFAPKAHERRLALLLDLPDEGLPDRPRWVERREIALSWFKALWGDDCDLEVDLFCYRNVKVNNADLPQDVWRYEGGDLWTDADQLPAAARLKLVDVLGRYPLAIALTQLSATAPLKLLAPATGCRAATMPGFTAAMIPALALDYREINRRVLVLKGLLDGAGRAEFLFLDRSKDKHHRLTLDLRHRQAHASGGLLPEAGEAGNLPSGEAYIVPYEGERGGDPSRSAGIMPVQFADEVVGYRIEHNKAVGVLDGGAMAEREAKALIAEPAYGNIAELGLGVLSDFGIKPIDEILLDEKLGLHLAFGRSDHFGGTVGPEDFSSPGAVVHIDRVYIPETQPLVQVEELVLHERDGGPLTLMRDGRYEIAL